MEEGLARSDAGEVRELTPVLVLPRKNRFANIRVEGAFFNAEEQRRGGSPGLTHEASQSVYAQFLEKEGVFL